MRPRLPAARQKFGLLFECTKDLILSRNDTIEFLYSQDLRRHGARSLSEGQFGAKFSLTFLLQSANPTAWTTLDLAARKSPEAAFTGR
jgi:hypothetical protein